MTESERIAQIEACQNVLTLYPADLLELVLWTTDEQTRAGEPCEPRPIFQEEA